MKPNFTPRSIVALLLALVLLVSFSACAAKNAAPMSPAAAPQSAKRADMDTAEAAIAEEMGMAYSTAQTGGANAPAGDDIVAQQDAGTRKIIYNADMSVTADDPAVALQTIIDENTALGGYLSTSYTRTDELGAYRCTAELKVPADKLDLLVASARATGKVDSYQLSSDDITLAYFDIAARLNSAKAEEKQLLLILEQCETIEDIIVVRESLAEVRADIESYQGQINLWDNLVSYATLYINISRTARASVETENELIALWKASDVWNRMTRAFQNSLRFVVNAAGALGIFLASVLIPGLIVFAIIFAIVKLNRKYNKKSQARREQRLARKAARDAAQQAKRDARREAKQAPKDE